MTTLTELSLFQIAKGHIEKRQLTLSHFLSITMQQADVQWSSEEKNIAESALKRAYDREVTAMLDCVRESAGKIAQVEDAWQLHDFLSARRHDIDGKYDDRESFLIFTLSKLIKDKLLDISELEGLAPDKRAKVSVLTRM